MTPEELQLVVDELRLGIAWRRETEKEGCGAGWQLAHLTHAGSEASDQARERRRTFVRRCREEADVLQRFVDGLESAP